MISLDTRLHPAYFRSKSKLSITICITSKPKKITENNLQLLFHHYLYFLKNFNLGFSRPFTKQTSSYSHDRQQVRYTLIYLHNYLINWMTYLSSLAKITDKIYLDNDLPLIHITKKPSQECLMQERKASELYIETVRSLWQRRIAWWYMAYETLCMTICLLLLCMQFAAFHQPTRGLHLSKDHI